MLANIILNQGSGRLEVVEKVPRKGPYLLRLIKTNGNGNGNPYLIEIYDTIEEANVAAFHFADCYRIAIEEGFFIKDDWFVHPSRHFVLVTEALAMDESESLVDPETFRQALQRVKTMN